jgi:hypothetical protein
MYIFNCNWVDTRWQQYSTHLRANSTQNTENGTYITTTKTKIFHNNKKIKTSEVRAVPRLCEVYPGICFTIEEKARKNLRVLTAWVNIWP